MIIPYSSRNETYKIGDKVVFTEETTTGFCIITIGHEATIVEKKNPRQESESYIKYNLIDSDGNVFEKMGSEDFSHIYTFNEARELFEDDNALNSVREICRTHCPHKTVKRLDRWDDYLSCELVEKSGFYTCKPTLSCLKYVNNDVYDNGVLPSEIEKYIRKQKIKKLI